MAHTRRALPKALPIGDSTVDGLLSGVAAAVPTSLYLILTGAAAGTTPADTLSLFAAGARAPALTGAIVQLALGGAYGALFGLLAALLSRRWHVRAPRAWLAGAIYGLALVGLTQLVVMPAVPALSHIPWGHWVAAHVVYGLALGYVFDRTTQA